MKSKVRTVVFFVTFLVASAVFQPAVTSAVSLLGEWDVFGRDVYSYTALLEFTSQTPDVGNFHLEGYFVWDQIGGPRGGTEIFIGTFFPDLSLTLQGVQLINPVGIGLGRYVGQVSSDGNRIDGSWVPPSGRWTATRKSSGSVPEPATLLLLASGLAGLSGIAWRRHRRG